MNDEEIKELLKTEGEILFLKKKSELGFMDVLYANNFILDFLLFFRKTKYDYLIITQERMIYINKNKLVNEFLYDINQGIKFNSLIPEVVFSESKGNKTNRIKFPSMRITYEEIKLIKNKLSRFEK